MNGPARNGSRCPTALLGAAWLWLAATGPAQVDLRERRLLLGVTVACALVAAGAVYWYLWRQDFWGWRTVSERRFRIIPAPPLTMNDLLPPAPAYGMRPAVNFGNADTSRCLAHASQLAGAEVTARSEDGLRFTCQGYTFELARCDDTDSTCLFVEDSACPDDLLLQVANHFNAVATVVEHYHQPAPLAPLWNMLIVAALLAALAVLAVLFAD